MTCIASMASAAEARDRGVDNQAPLPQRLASVDRRIDDQTGSHAGRELVDGVIDGENWLPAGIGPQPALGDVASDAARLAAKSRRVRL